MRWLPLVILCFSDLAWGIDFSVLAVKSVRVDGVTPPGLPEVLTPTRHPPSDLVIIHPDGREEVLVSGRGIDAICDPKTLDGVNVYFVRIPDTMNRNHQRRNVPIGGADIFSINVETREETRWTEQGDHLPLQYADDPNFRYGVFNMGPQPLPDGRLVFTSSRFRLQATKFKTFPCMQLHVRHPDGRVERIGPLSQGSALHPELLRDGRIAFSSYESMLLRDARLWSIWQIHPDGTNWGPLFSAYNTGTAFHFHGQRSNGELFTAEYYNGNNQGFGTIWGCDEYPTYAPLGSEPRVRAGYHFNGKTREQFFGFSPSGFRNLTPWTHGRDQISPRKSWVPETSLVSANLTPGEHLGKVTHPAATPNNGILVTYSGGPANNLRSTGDHLPVQHCEIRLIWEDLNELGPDGMLPIAAHDDFNYTQPRALVSHDAIYGQPPVALPDKTNPTKHYGVFGSSDAFEGQWKFDDKYRVGIDTGVDSPPKSLLILGAEPNIATMFTRNVHNRFFSTDDWDVGRANERLRILGEYEFDEPDRPKGDYSFRVKVPADVPFTVAIRGEDGRIATIGQSWKQVRPGYQEIKCGGCHNHAAAPIPSTGKYAWRDDYVLRDFTGKPRSIEYRRDVMPILQRRCGECHTRVTGGFGIQPSAVLTAVERFKTGRSRLSQVIREGHARVSPDERQTIEDWIALGGMISIKSNSAFDNWFQTVNPNPIDEPIPIP